MGCEECQRRESSGLQNRELRRQMKDLGTSVDEMFVAMCDSDRAVNALGELWGSGEFDCGPEDYEYMVERCLEALRGYSECRTSPARLMCQQDWREHSMSF